MDVSNKESVRKTFEMGEKSDNCVNNAVLLW